MASQSGHGDWSTRGLYALAIVAAVFFLVLMALAIQSGEDTTGGENPTPTAAPEAPAPTPNGG